VQTKDLDDLLELNLVAPLSDLEFTMPLSYFVAADVCANIRLQLGWGPPCEASKNLSSSSRLIHWAMESSV
jgi:hypothetical protein